MVMPQPGTHFDEAEHPAADEKHPVLAKLKSLVGASSTQWGFDYAWENYTAAQIVRLLNSNNADFVCRYINDPGGKGIDAAEAAALDAADIIIAPVYETTGTDFTGGYSAGMRAGATAAALLRARGAPAGTYCWFAIDTGTSDFGDTNNYLRGAKAGTAEFIAQLYGSYSVVEAAYRAGLGDKHWQTYAWSAGKLSSHAAMYQYQNGVLIGGVSMDRDRTLTHMNGPWAHFGAAPTPPHPTPPAADWTEQMIMALPTLGPSDTDTAGEIQYVHRIQALVQVIGQVNNLPAAAAVTPDGIYGPQTIAGVKAIQGFFGNSQDGITGRDTWHALVAGS
jgi:peptidoglycan hydrolase-like protein with peptidoglycan-binding domain